MKTESVFCAGQVDLNVMSVPDVYKCVLIKVRPTLFLSMI